MTVPAQTPNVGLNYGWETGDDDWGGPVNWNWLLLDVVSTPFAKSITLTVPPASPEDGDRYIIPAGATGVWASKVGRIAYYTNDQWLYFQPKKGWYQRVFDTHKTYVWNGVEWEYYLDSVTPEMMAQINAAVAAGDDAVEAAASTAADRDAVHQDRIAVDAARQSVDASAAQVSSDKAAAVSAKNTAVAAASDAATSKQSSSENAVIAVQKAQEAAASAGSASTSATTANTASSQAVSAKTDLFNRYYGGLSSDPATRPDGTPCQEGDEYFNTADDKRKVYTSAGWVWDGGIRENDLGTDANLSSNASWDAVPSASGAGTVSTVMNQMIQALLNRTAFLRQGSVFGQEAASGKRFRLIMGSIRNTGDGWKWINDAYHFPAGSDPVGSVEVVGSYIRINYSFTAARVGTLLACPDETMAQYGLTCGCSVGVNYSDLSLSAPLDFSINLADNSVINTHPFAGNITVSTASGISTITHSDTVAKYPPSVTPARSTGGRLLNFPTVGWADTGMYIEHNTELGGIVLWNGTAWSFVSDVDTARYPVTLTWNAGAGRLDVTHPNCPNAYDLQLSPRSATLIPVISPASGTLDVGKFSVEFYDYAGVKQTTLPSGLQFSFNRPLLVKSNKACDNIYTIRRGPALLKPDNVVSSSGNIWILGLMEVN